jgi:hypothetical protein
MSVLKDDGTKRLIDQILASLKVGKYAIMDKALNINSKNPVENKVITQAINGLSNSRPQVIADRGSSYDVLDNVKIITYQESLTVTLAGGQVDWIKIKELNTDLFPPSKQETSNWLVFINMTYSNDTNFVCLGGRLVKRDGVWNVGAYLKDISATGGEFEADFDIMIVDVREV